MPKSRSDALRRRNSFRIGHAVQFRDDGLHPLRHAIQRAYCTPACASGNGWPWLRGQAARTGKKTDLIAARWPPCA